MCDPQTFDSRDSRYKRPYGAVPSGTRVELALRPPRAGGFSAATLIAYFEHRDEERRELPMPWRGLEGDRDVFAVTLETGDYVGLVWYSFRLEGLDGRREELGPFQLTVYDGAEEVPATLIQGDSESAVTLKLTGMTAEERDIVLAGCLINYYAK